MAVWSREWIGWWSLPAVALVLVFMMLSVTYAVQVVGMANLAYGLVELDLPAVVSGLLITQTAKAWFIDAWCCCTRT
jgi:hypothetical protein